MRSNGVWGEEKGSPLEVVGERTVEKKRCVIATKDTNLGAVKAL